ncbi:hypothetical protein AOA12_02580 [Microbacterium sp. No. 7]|nr:hypothetical protein AOA12_02580 [Microbacterium sp. No. 7]
MDDRLPRRRGPALALRFDLRAPAFGTPPAELYEAALVLSELADGAGFERITVSEHHHADDGYLPAVTVMAGAIAARTRRARIRFSALILPLHDPLRVAEDLAVLDVISAGRAEATVAAGYRAVEFEMLGVPFAGRGTRLASSIGVLRTAWRGEPFEVEGRPALVRPVPVQPGGPPLIMGGSTPLAARRAARIADGFDPSTPAVLDEYVAECERLGKAPGDHRRRVGPFSLHVSLDPERTRALLEPHVRHEQNAYRQWDADVTIIAGEQEETDVWSAGTHVVVTPEQAVDALDALDGSGVFTLHPLVAGVDPEVAFESMTLLRDRVLPSLSARRA